MATDLFVQHDEIADAWNVGQGYSLPNKESAGLESLVQHWQSYTDSLLSNFGFLLEKKQQQNN